MNCVGCWGLNLFEILLNKRFHLENIKRILYPKKASLYRGKVRALWEFPGWMTLSTVNPPDPLKPMINGSILSMVRRRLF
jgi:hypothetical protein